MQQFPYPRKSSAPHVYTSTRTSAYQQRRLLKRYAPPFAGFLGLIWLLTYLFSSRNTTTTHIPPGTPPVIIVTPLSPKLSESHKESIKENRRTYAARHGYSTFFPNTTDYDLLPKTPESWSLIPSLRHTMTTNPHTPWLWHLSSESLIMNPRPSLETQLLSPTTLQSLLIKDHPVVPPDSVIHTLSHLSTSSINLIISQDDSGLGQSSFLLRTGDWAKFFLDAWFDPLYRSYNFQKAEGHALEHIVQWHGTVLSKLGLVPQRVMNSYSESSGEKREDGLYQEGDFVATFHNCSRDLHRSCEKEMASSMTRWKELRDAEQKRRKR
ncbi:putative glycosyltransferase 34, nucleotide-diphospho-sugar transferase [Septoria linicola]|nr:putative glycosyltransferase 34, nucleotide-diphospho-sugar transferase [Septoria linicola]